MMRAEGSIENEILPEYVFDAADECEAPGSLAITSNDLTNVLNAYQHYMIVQPADDKIIFLPLVVACFSAARSGKPCPPLDLRPCCITKL